MFDGQLDPRLLLRATDPAAVRTDRALSAERVAALRIDVAERGTLEDRTRLARFLARQAWADTLLGAPHDALLAFDEARRWYGADDRGRALLLTAIRHAHAHTAVDELDAAHDGLETEASRYSLDTNTALWAAYGELASVVRAGIALARGDQQSAMRWLGRALEVIEARPRPNDVMGVRLALDALRSRP